MSTPATLSEVAATVREVLADGRPLDDDELLETLRKHGLDLGADPGETLVRVLESDELPLVVPLGSDGRHVWLPALLRGRTFTHRVSAAEIDQGFLDVSPDLEPVSMLAEDETYRRLVDGTELTQVLPDFDPALLEERGIAPGAVGECGWVLAPGALRGYGLAPGDLIGVTVRPDGFELGPVTEAAPAPGTGARLTEVLASLGEGAPAQIDGVVWEVCAHDPALFDSPQPPLGETLGAAGMVTAGELVGPPGFDFAGWRADRRLERIADLHRLDEDRALAVLVLTQLYEQAAEVFDHAQAAVDAGESLADVLPDLSDADDSASGVPEVDRLGFLADPDVAEAVLVEAIGPDQEGAAALGMFAETLEPQAPRAARPALQWLRGRAHDRLGHVLDAEQAYEQALSLEPTSPLALFELARVASDRGDVDRGLSLLQRAGAASDDELVELLEAFRPPVRDDIGRNERCWCGSGRKYKVCHRNREALPLEQRAAWLYQKAGHYLSDGPWRGRAIDVASIRAEHWESRDATWQAIQDPLVGDAVLFEGGAFAAFLETRGALLPDDERLLAEQWLLVERSVHEIEQVSPGAGFTARDVRTGERVEVREGTASRQLRTGALICARLVPAGETVQCFGGIEPVTLAERDALIRVLDTHPGPEEVVANLSRRFAPPELQNTEGESLVWCEATLRGDDPAALADQLDAAYDRDEGESRWFEHVTTRGTEQVRATLTQDGADIHVEANSEARLDRVLAHLQSLQPGLQLHSQTRRPAAEVREAMSRAPDDAPATTLDPADPEVADALAQVIHAHEQAWLDESIPALGGVTPREAAADPTRRPDLVRLLDSFGPAGPGTMDPDRLRAELGL